MATEEETLRDLSQQMIEEKEFKDLPALALKALDKLTKGIYCPKGTKLCTDCETCEKNRSLNIIYKALKRLEELEGKL